MLVTSRHGRGPENPAADGDRSRARFATVTAVDDQGESRLDFRSIGAEPLEDEDPRQIGAFPVRAVLGSGGMGRVYLGVAPEGYTAVKRVLPYLASDRTFLRHFGQELDNQARLPAGVSARLLAADRTARPPWFATEYIPGVTLHDAVHLSGGRLPVHTAWVLMRELAARLRAIAALDMVHRDLKPSNVMLTQEGLTLIDFGIARAADQSSVTATGLAVGTPAFMAPEQAQATRELTPALDVFSLGAVLAFATTGVAPFGEGSGAALFYRIVHQAPDLHDLPGLDPALADPITACLDKDPGARPTAAELVEAAAARATPGPPAWPAAVTLLIATRKAFAETTITPDPEPEQDPDETELESGADDAAQAAGESGEAAVLTAEPVVPVSIGDGLDLAASAEAETVALANGAPNPREPKERRSRKKTLALILPLVLVCGGTAGTLIGLHDLPFPSGSPNNGGDHALGGSTGTGGPTSSASPGTSGAASGTASPGHSGPAASPKPSKGAGGTGTTGSGGSNGSGGTGSNGSGGTGTGSGGTGGNGSGGGTQTSAPPVTKTTSPGSGGGGGSGGRTVVSSSYSLLESAAAGTCITDSDNGIDISLDTCDGGDSQQGWRAVSVSGGIEVVNQSSGFCLTNPNGGIVSLFNCGEGSSQVWSIGTDTSSGGTLENDGACMYYTSLNGGMVEMASCNASDSGRLWYDGGSA
jgi:serine/threonine protein kinase